jgi:molecular chaperone HscA
MLLDALDHGEEDLAARRLAEERVEAHRIASAAKKALDKDASLLEPGEFESIGDAIREVEAAAAGADPGKIHASIEALDHTSKPFATRRMNRAIALAIEGKTVDEATAVVERP